MIRFFDFIFSGLGLIILSPVFLFVSIIIIIESKGSALFKQTRVGINGKDFVLYKFRSMTANTESKGQLTIGTNDLRITKVGKFIRKYKIDELPQLINVFIGDMSLVGPRPEVRKYTDLYSVNQMIVLQVKPGITDYASLEFINENEILGKVNEPEKVYIEQIMPAKIELNKKYINNYSLKSYFKLIFLTILSIMGLSIKRFL